MRKIGEISDMLVESGTIATLIYHPEFILNTPWLKEEHFYHNENKRMFTAIKSLYINNHIKNINALNLSHAIDDNQSLDASKEQNLSSIQEYIDLAFYSARESEEEYFFLARKVLELAFKRDFYMRSVKWQDKCFDKNMEIDKFSNLVYKDLNKISTNYIYQNDISMFGNTVDSMLDKLNTSLEKTGSLGLPPYFKSLKPFFTYENGELFVFEARMKQGKSWIALMEALHKAANGVPTILYDSEMSDFNFYIRAISYLSGVETTQIKSPSRSSEESAKIQRAHQKLKSLPFWHINDPLMSKEKFYSICAQIKNEHGLGFVVWDYIKANGKILDSAERSAYLADKTDWLKNNIAGEFDIPVVAFCQLNRNYEVAESDGIEKYCSAAIQWGRKNDNEILKDGAECGTHKMSVKLNRLGMQHEEGDYIDMIFTGGAVRITEAEQHHSESPF